MAQAGVKKTVKKTVMKRKVTHLIRAAAPAGKPTAATTRQAKGASSKPPAALTGISGVCINLKTRPDRWVKVSKSVAKQAPWLNLARMDAVDGRVAPPPAKEVTRTWCTGHLAELFHWYKKVTVPMSPGEMGCCGSHVKAWRMAAKSSKPLLVLEDDAVALPTFSSTLAQAVKEAPKDIGMIFLSSKDRGSRTQAGKVLMTPSFVWTTVGYLIYPATAKKLLAMLPVDMPVDNFLAWHIKEGTIKAFSVKPACVRQAQTWNLGSDVPHSDDVAHQ